MTGIGEKAPFALSRALQRAEHCVERAGELADLLRVGRLCESPGSVAGLLDLGRRRSQLAEGSDAAPGQQRRRQAADEDGYRAAEQEQDSQLVQGVLDVGRAGCDQCHPAGRGAADVGDRRREDPDRFSAQLRFGVAAIAAQRRADLGPARQQLRAECQRAGDYDPAAIQDLDAQLPARQRRFERARRSEHRRRGNAEARDFDRSLAQAAVER